MNIMDTIAGRDLEALRAATAGQASYDQARQGCNLAVDTRPAVIAGGVGSADLRLLVTEPALC